MLAKTNYWIFVLIATLFVGLFVMLSLPVQVSAAQMDVSSINSCLTCHEDLYFLHDSGKYYCITEHKDRCVNCHEGNADVMNLEEAHQGLIAYPQKDNGAKCQQCHTQDAPARLAKFASLGGYKTVIEASPYTPSSPLVAGFPDVSEPNQVLENLPWLVGALVLFGIWLMLVLFSPLKP